MNVEAFDSVKWTGQMRVEYKNKIYDVASVDFEERLIGISGYCDGGDESDVQWIRCENAVINKL